MFPMKVGNTYTLLNDFQCISTLATIDNPSDFLHISRKNERKEGGDEHGIIVRWIDLTSINRTLRLRRA